MAQRDRARRTTDRPPVPRPTCPGCAAPITPTARHCHGCENRRRLRALPARPVCEACRTPMTGSRARLLRRGGPYRCRECRMTQAKQTAARGGGYGPEWGAIRRVVKKRAGYRCEACRVEARRRKPLQVHHIVPFATSRDNGYGNLIVLCHACHLRVHRLYREYECGTARQYRHVCKAAKQAIRRAEDPHRRGVRIGEFLDREIVPLAA